MAWAVSEREYNAPSQEEEAYLDSLLEGIRAKEKIV